MIDRELPFPDRTRSTKGGGRGIAHSAQPRTTSQNNNRHLPYQGPPPLIPVQHSSAGQGRDKKTITASPVGNACLGILFSESRGTLCNLSRQERVQLLVSGLNAREINRHGAKQVAQASTAELSDSRSSRERPRASQEETGTIDGLALGRIPLGRSAYMMDNDNEQVGSCCNQEGARQTSKR